MENSNIFYDRLLRDQFNEEEQLDIVSKDPSYIMHMFDATTKVQEKAIIKEPNVIRYIRDQSEHIKMFALKHGCLLKYIKEPTVNMEFEAIQINPINIVYSNHNSSFYGKELLDYAIQCNAIRKINESLETDDCDKCKATLEKLYDRRRVKYLEEERLKCKKDSYCTIS
jgi:hypothetical protein